MVPAPAEIDGNEEGAGRAIVHRHPIAVRLWHWLNAISIIVMLMSGLMIFNAHPQLYWGAYGANADPGWLAIAHGNLRVGPIVLNTGGILGNPRAFPGWITIPSHYDLAEGRRWHFAFAWLLVVPGIVFLLWGFVGRHFRRDLAPHRDELRPHYIWQDIKDHARLRFPTGAAARDYNILQKLAYCGVIFVAIPGAILTGMTMSPGLDAGWPWLLAVFGGRQSARSIHFICAMALAAFILIHLIMVLLAGPVNEIRSMISGWYRLPEDRE